MRVKWVSTEKRSEKVKNVIVPDYWGKVGIEMTKRCIKTFLHYPHYPPSISSIDKGKKILTGYASMSFMHQRHVSPFPR